MSPAEAFAELSADTTKTLAVEHELVARLEGEQAILRARWDECRRDLGYRHELAWVESQLRRARANVERLLSGRPYPIVYHPQAPSRAAMQHLSLAAVDGVAVTLVTCGTSGRGTPRVELGSKYARYGAASKLTVAEARDFGHGLVEGAARLAAAPPVPEPGTFGPQAETLAHVPNIAWADLIEKGADNRGKRRIALKLKGCRYPISLDADDARRIGEGLIEAAELLAADNR